MPSERLALALSLIDPSDWRYFERLASEFNAVEHPSLRTMAAMHGDGGRDAQLHIPHEDLSVAFQYSVASDWRAKINATVATLAKNFSDVQRLIYCTSQVVGPAADDLKQTLREKKIDLDVRDASWFIERELTHPQRATASEEFCARLIGDLLHKRGLASRVATALSGEDARVALVHLSLDGYDQKSEKGLTKSSFEALVRSVMHDTSSGSAMSAEEIVAQVSQLVPSGDRQQVAEQATGALRRLSVKNGPIKHNTKTQQYHLSFEEQESIAAKTAQFLLEDEQLQAELRERVSHTAPDCPVEQLDEIAGRARTAIENLLLLRGEEFAAAVLTGDVQVIDLDDAVTAVGLPEPEGISLTALGGIVLSSLERPGPATQRHLRQLADGYTLFAFLRETPDVQKVVLQVFQDGDIWIDTNILLPVLAETLIEDTSGRQFSNLLLAASDAGINLYVTDGVIEEVLSHINLSLAFARTPSAEWNGRVPFLYAAYTWSGRGRKDFRGWASGLRSDALPEDDIQQVLEDDYGIKVRNLAEHADASPIELRSAVQEVWEESRERKQARHHEPPNANAHRLVAHDVENYVGVIQLRRASRIGPMGYREWWLTLDRVAFTLVNELRKRIAGTIPASPALSPDFLTELIRLGPLRSSVEREVHVSLPTMAGIARFENVPVDLIDLADSIREQMKGSSERAIAWKVRDALNDARWRLGQTAKAGIKGMEEVVRENMQSDSTGAP